MSCVFRQIVLLFFFHFFISFERNLVSEIEQDKEILYIVNNDIWQPMIKTDRQCTTETSRTS
jgi:hypothetical protein